MVEGTTKKQRQRIVIESTTTAALVAIAFMFAGKWVLNKLGITIQDFQIAGGALLFVIAVRLLLPGTQKFVVSEGRDKDVGVFPLGTPLITGPAVLTTTLMMLDSYGKAVTFVALVLNMLIVWITLVQADSIMKVMGSNGTRAFAKIMYILLAAIAVMMIRRGVEGILLR
jgi:multiple antibiotic resistance protein